MYYVHVSPVVITATKQLLKSLPSVGAPDECSVTQQSSTENDSLPVVQTPSVPNSLASTSESHSVPAHLSDQCPFALGDNVRVELDVEIFKMMQEGHGDYDDQLLQVSILSNVHLLCVLLSIHCGKRTGKQEQANLVLQIFSICRDGADMPISKQNSSKLPNAAVLSLFGHIHPYKWLYTQQYSQKM